MAGLPLGEVNPANRASCQLSMRAVWGCLCGAELGNHCPQLPVAPFGPVTFQRSVESNGCSQSPVGPRPHWMREFAG